MGAQQCHADAHPKHEIVFDTPGNRGAVWRPLPVVHSLQEDTRSHRSCRSCTALDDCLDYGEINAQQTSPGWLPASSSRSTLLSSSRHWSRAPTSPSLQPQPQPRPGGACSPTRRRRSSAPAAMVEGNRRPGVLDALEQRQLAASDWTGCLGTARCGAPDVHEESGFSVSIPESPHRQACPDNPNEPPWLRAALSKPGPSGHRIMCLQTIYDRPVQQTTPVYSISTPRSSPHTSPTLATIEPSRGPARR